jgi:hypothetical protein
MRSALVEFMAADAGVVGIARSNVSWGYRSQGDPLPALTLVKTDGADDVAIDGVTGFVDGHAQADCWGATAEDAANLAAAVRSAASRMNEATTGGVIQGVFVTHEQDESEGEKPDRLFRTRLALRVPYSAA